MTSDLGLYLYAFGGVVLVFICFVVFAVFTEFVRSINQKMVDEEKKKKEERLKSRHAA